MLYLAMDVKYVIEITPRANQPLGPSPQPVRILQPVPQQPGTDWTTVIGTGLVITAGVIIVATVVEDFLTLGAGVADDPISFAAAGAAFVRGMAMIRGATASLPLAAAPASVVVRGSVQFAH